MATDLDNCIFPISLCLKKSYHSCSALQTKEQLRKSGGITTYGRKSFLCAINNNHLTIKISNITRKRWIQLYNFFNTDDSNLRIHFFELWLLGYQIYIYQFPDKGNETENFYTMTCDHEKKGGAQMIERRSNIKYKINTRGMIDILMNWQRTFVQGICGIQRNICVSFSLFLC